MLIKQEIVQIKESEGNRFPYIDFGSETHGRTSFRLWVSGKLIQEQDGKPVVTFPLRATIMQTEKGSLVLRPGEQTIYNIYVRCGYRGSGLFQILEPIDAQVFGYRIFSSPRGSCGVSYGALVQVPVEAPIKIRWKRTGRLYGSPANGLAILYPDGREEVIDHFSDGLEELAVLEEMLS